MPENQRPSFATPVSFAVPLPSLINNCEASLPAAVANINTNASLVPMLHLPDLVEDDGNDVASILSRFRPRRPVSSSQNSGAIPDGILLPTLSERDNVEGDLRTNSFQPERPKLHLRPRRAPKGRQLKSGGA